MEKEEIKKKVAELRIQLGKLSSEKRDLILQKKKFFDLIGDKVVILKKQREEILKIYSEIDPLKKKFSSLRPAVDHSASREKSREDMYKLNECKKEINAIEQKLETDVLKPTKEKEMTARLRILKKQAAEMKGENKKEEVDSEKLKERATIGKELDEKRLVLRKLETEFSTLSQEVNKMKVDRDALNKKIDGLSETIKKVGSEVDGYAKELNEQHAAEMKAREERPKPPRQERTERRERREDRSNKDKVYTFSEKDKAAEDMMYKKYLEVKERMSKGKTLTTEDLLLLQQFDKE